jgi:selenide,water dikinase
MIEAALEYQKQKIGPGATARNWNSYQAKVSIGAGINEEEAMQLLPDPQTNGGLLIAVSPEAVPEVMEVFETFGLSAYAKPIGKLKAKTDKVIEFL